MLKVLFIWQYCHAQTVLYLKAFCWEWFKYNFVATEMQQWGLDLHSYLKKKKPTKYMKQLIKNEQRRKISELWETGNKISPVTAPFTTLNVQATSQKKGIQLEPSELAELRIQKWFSGENKATGEIEKFIIIIGVFSILL